MKYTYIELSRYLPFSFSGIKTLIIHSEAATQVIIGANGSGKSSLLREISPLPAVRTDYGPNGYKKLTLEHRGAIYELTSDFSNRSAPHSFRRDGHELNGGGTTAVQEDLVRSHLGYTRQIEKLVTGQYNLAEMSEGFRKALLMEISPFNLGFLLERHRETRAALRACKNNLTMLHERKLALEAEILPKEELDQLVAERTILDRELTQIVEYIHRVDETLRTSNGAKASAQGSHPLPNYLTLVKTIQQASADWRHVSRDNPERQLSTIRERIQQAEAVMPHLTEQIGALASEIDTYQAKLDEIAERQSQGDLAQDVASLKQEILKLETSITDQPFPEYAMAKLPSLLEELRVHTQVFLGCPIRLISQRHLQRKHFLRERWHQKRLSVTRMCEQLEQRLTEIHAKTNIVMADIPTNNCGQMVCPLYRLFVAQAGQTEREVNDLTSQLERGKRQLARLRVYLDGTTEQLREMEQFTPHLYHLSLLLRDHPYLKPADTFDLLSLLQKSPLSLHREAELRYTESQATHLQRHLKKVLEEKLTLLSRLKELDVDELDFLKTVLAEKQAVLAALHVKTSDHQTTIRSLRQEQDTTLNYLNSLDALSAAEADLNRILERATDRYEYEILTRIRGILQTARVEHVGRMGAIDHRFRSQESLLSRYGEEVIGQIQKIEKDRHELEQLEFALEGIPHHYTVTFLNAMIALMNEYIALVFSYPLALLPLEIDKPLDYRFPMQVGEVEVSDISKGSEAQKEIINLVFSLSIMKQRQLSDYPIFLDEVGKAFDAHHKQSLLYLFQNILEEGTVSSLFLVNHNDTIINGLPNAETLVLNELNIVVPSVYNQHVEIIYA